MPLAWFHFFSTSRPLFRVFRDTRERAREHLIPRESFVIYMYGSIDDDWNDGRAMDPARGFFYLCQIIAIGSSGRKAGKHSRYLQIAMRHARASAFLPSFAPGLDEIHPRPVMARPSSVVSFTPFREATLHSYPKPFKDSPYPSQSTPAAQFTFASFLLPSYPSLYLFYPFVFRSEHRCQFNSMHSCLKSWR